MPRMGKTEEDWNGLKLGFLKTVQPNSISKLISAVCNFKNNEQETYWFISNLWFCHSYVISLLTLSFVAIAGEQLAKFNKMNWTAVTQPLKLTFFDKCFQYIVVNFFNRMVCRPDKVQNSYTRDGERRVKWMSHNVLRCCQARGRHRVQSFVA